ncbi:hypothetical protein C7974DRAFT_384599 [Boeremia exigua]|uniref:uncharacterized protein n=1 Tax=Boeremia exigua TaxID=749465 RepID=UPI001E8E7CDF|nr:uncharacterized protein C7974DRAFT_384599 [Boeremia exigua]KAH6641970.1 hypothetical protein C7974DRAFT_384599 [Boeremia exigua]
MASSTNVDVTEKVEDFRAGYPQFSALISAYGPFFLCRRFDRIRARILLLKQERLSVLEAKLDNIDKHEQCPLFLGSSRSDKNDERLAVLLELEEKLLDYDTFLKNTRSLFDSSAAESKDITSLQNWLSATGCIPRDETMYLSHTKDLASLASPADNPVLRLESWVERTMVWLWHGFRNNHQHNLSDNPNVYLYSGTRIRRIARTILLLLITCLLLSPVVICSVTHNSLVRLAVVMVSTLLYLSVLAATTKARTIELVVAGATYATVLVVFVSGADSN